MNFTNTIAEEYVISAILNEPDEIIPKLKAEHFSNEHFHNHLPKLIWNKCLDFYSKGRGHEITLLEFTDDIKGMDEGRNIAHDISRIRVMFAGSEFLKQHISEVKENYATRIGYKIASEALESFGEGIDPLEMSSKLRSGSEEMMEVMQGETGWKNCKESLEEFTDMLIAIHHEKTAVGIPSGLHELDLYTGGLHSNELWVVAAKTSGGKTVLMFQIMNNFIRLGKKVLLFSLETESAMVHARLSCNSLRIDMNRILGKGGFSMDKSQMTKVKTYVDEMMESDNLTICDSDNITLEEIRSTSDQLRDSGREIDLIVIDYIQLVGLVNAKDKSRQEQVAEVTRHLKQLGKRFKCPVLTASQLNDDGKVRESRAISHDADVLLKIGDDSDCIMIAKNRNGERGVDLPLSLNGSMQRFE